jgi:DegV family protein with EDD domain
MAIKFVIDSASDILPEQAKELGMVHLPLTVNFGSTEYEDSVTLSHKEFYEKLIESETLPSTSQISPAVYEQVYKELVAQGHTVIVITLSGKLSGTYQSAMIAAEDYAGKVFVVDSENVCIGEQILIKLALELQAKGLSAEEIVDELNREKKNVQVLALLDTLEYLKKGGRISAAAAIAGSLLSIKPVIAVEHREVVVLGKARGSKNGSNMLMELVQKEGGIRFDRPFCLAYSGLSDRLLQKYITDSAALYQGHTEALPISTIGSTIGTHVGPGAIAAAFFAKE